MRCTSAQGMPLHPGQYAMHASSAPDASGAMLVGYYDLRACGVQPAVRAARPSRLTKGQQVWALGNTPEPSSGPESARIRMEVLMATSGEDRSEGPYF